MPLSELSYKSADGTQIVAYKWEPEDDRGPRAAVQMTHGMGEHALRYDHVAQALNDSLQAALTNRKDPNAALQEAQATATRLLRAYQK